MPTLQLEGIRGRSGHSEVALVSFRGLEKREAGCVAVPEAEGGWEEGGLRQKLFAVDGCRVHANCHQKDAEHVPVCPLCKHAQHASPHSHSPPLLLCPVDLYARCGPKQRRFFSCSASDVVQTFLPSGKQQDRSSCHWTLKAHPLPAYLYRTLPVLPPLTAPRSRPATIHFELLNFEKATRAKTDIIFEDSGCSRSNKTNRKK